MPQRRNTTAFFVCVCVCVCVVKETEINEEINEQKR